MAYACYWAGHPAMHIVQALYWLRDSLKNDDLMTQEIKTKLIRLLQDPNQGSQICEDLQAGLHTVPLWMRVWIQGSALNLLIYTKSLSRIHID